MHASLSSSHESQYPIQFQILTLFPEMIHPYVQSSMIGKAQTKGLIEIAAIDIRKFTHDKHLKVDDTPYGGGAGMVLMCQPIDDALASLALDNPTLGSTKLLLTSPAGKPFIQETAKQWAATYQRFVILCGHYEGFDERIHTLYPEIEEVSIGDFVLTGGELPALCLVDALARMVPGVVKEEASVVHDSFYDGILDHPHYTRPAVYKDIAVPQVLLSGNHAHIEAWRKTQAMERTKQRRPDLLSP
ncbi:MAG: tRNA (guanosine(37)-N1)-methyltransferase TrmD [Vampirovibrionales bacterium]